MGKGEIARYEQFLLFPQCFQTACFPGASKSVIVWEWVKTTPMENKMITANERLSCMFILCLQCINGMDRVFKDQTAHFVHFYLALNWPQWTAIYRNSRHSFNVLIKIPFKNSVVKGENAVYCIKKQILFNLNQTEFVICKFMHSFWRKILDTSILIAEKLSSEFFLVETWWKS